ncbi:MAG: hypothetical protein M5U26_23690 [Planctomycetota bacterium]|nr:hypothetical protein [Planctomycetota bacterium]
MTSTEAPPPVDGPRGRRFDPEALADLQGERGAGWSAPTWRGWALALGAVAVFSLLIPYIDYVLRGSRLTLNLMPAGSVFLLLALPLILNLGLARVRRQLALSRADLALIFCLTFVTNPLPGGGMMSYLTAMMFGPQQFADQGNGWQEQIVAELPPELMPQDPQDPTSDAPRPVAWLYTGLPEGRAIPWSALAGPYARWFVMFLLALGMFLAAAMLLRKQWADHEKLDFPMTQVPLEMLNGLESGDSGKPFLLDRMALYGILVTLLLHSYNALHDYLPMIEPLPLKSDSFGARFLTEGPVLRALNPVNFNIYPAILGITYLLSTEVSFSLWFMHWVKKFAIVVLVVWRGLGANEYFFTREWGERGIFINQGVGALIATVLVGVWLARKPLGDSLRLALGRAPSGPEDEAEGLSARWTWLLLFACAAGSVVWLCLYFKAGAGWAILAVLLLLILNIGVARMVSEAGIFYLEINTHAAGVLSNCFSPAALGAHNFLALNVWSRVLAFDYLRSSPTITLFQSLHFAGQARLRRGSLIAGLGLALALCCACSFFGFFSALYHNPSGLEGNWALSAFVKSEYGHLARRHKAVQQWEQVQAEAAAAGAEPPAEKRPDVARINRDEIRSYALGAALLGLFLFLRSRVFWWPHPIGLLMWAGWWAIMQTWFSYFLGWLIKVLILKFGGFRVYGHWRRFFIGLIVGELVATVLWLTVAYCTGTKDTYPMHFN